MLKKHKIIWFMTVLLFVIFSGVLTACADDGTKVETDSIQDRPVEIVSVEGPLDPINPGGPVVGITLKNTSIDNIFSLNATLKLERLFIFEFEVSDKNPLLPGNTIYSERILIGGGFSGSDSYPLEINGSFQDGTIFSYTENVMIK
jgi:hypothetical protein